MLLTFVGQSNVANCFQEKHETLILPVVVFNKTNGTMNQNNYGVYPRFTQQDFVQYARYLHLLQPSAYAFCTDFGMFFQGV